MGEDERATEERLSPAHLARSADVDEGFVAELVRLGIVDTEGPSFRSTDVYRARFAKLLVDSGIELEDAARAIDAGIVSFGDLETMFPRPPLSTDLAHDDLARELGMDVDSLMTLRLAAGLPAQAAGDPVRSDDMAILRHIVSIAVALVGLEHAPTVGRMYGDRAERTAAAALALYREQVDRPWLEAGVPLDTETSRRGSQAGRRLLDVTEELLLALYRRAVDEGVLAGWLETTEELMARHGYLAERPRPTPGIAFVDLSGYTDLTATEGDEAGAMVATRLLSEAQRVTASSGVRLVKLLGDGVMLQGDDPGLLAETIVELIAAIASSDMPPAHAGVHPGPMVERDGDYFGHTVNVAARISSVATAGEVLVSAAVASRLPGSLDATELAPRALRGVSEQLGLYRFERR